MRNMRMGLRAVVVGAASVALGGWWVKANYDAVFTVGGSGLASVLLADHSQWHVPKDKLDYSDLSMWAAHPSVKDLADTLPVQSASEHGLKDRQDDATADVFFVHPSTYFGSQWIAPVRSKLNPLGWSSDLIAWIVAGVHGNAFNGVGRIYSPRYRQMSGLGFLSKDEDSIKSAMDFAYNDLRRAFQHFLAETKQDTPFFLAGHSQGSIHLGRLLVEEVAPNPALLRRFVAGYLLGGPLTAKDVAPIPVCASASQTGCVVGYNLFWHGGNAQKFVLLPANASLAQRKQVICVNPLSWKANEDFVPAHANPGSRPIQVADAILGGDTALGFGRLKKGLFSAQCSNGVLWTEAPSSSGFHVTGVFPGYNAHGGETSHYWLALRQNAEQRFKAHIE